MTGTYYNDHDPDACAWLRELIRDRHLPDGEVDQRSILDVHPDDLRGFRQCHFFAGIGGWPYALRLAGIPDDAPIWTGSPPCQPFSAAGKLEGRHDARHLAPHFLDLVRACRPRLLFGEQVASAAVFGGASARARRGAAVGPEWAWFDDLSDRLEAARYAVGASDIPAAGIGAPHIRQRCFFGAASAEWLADAVLARRAERRPGSGDGSASGRDGAGGLADPHDAGSQGRGEPGRERAAERPAGPGGVAGGLADADGGDARAEREQRGREYGQQPQDGRAVRGADRGAWQDPAAGMDWPGPADDPWRAADWLFCRDGLWRPVEPGTSPLAHGLPARVGRLRGYGNAIVPQAAAEFVRGFLLACAIEFGAGAA